MGIPLLNVMFQGLSLLTISKIQIPMVIFQGFQMMIGSLLTLAFRRWIQSDEKAKDKEGGEAM